MKRKIIYLLAAVLIICLALTSCGSSANTASNTNAGSNANAGSNSANVNNQNAASQAVTLEKWIAEHPDSMKGVKQEEGLEISFENNSVIYKYDISKASGASEEVAKSEYMKKALEDGIANAEDTFMGIVENLEKSTGIEGITVQLIYTYKDTVIVSHTFSK